MRDAYLGGGLEVSDFPVGLDDPVDVPFESELIEALLGPPVLGLEEGFRGRHDPVLEFVFRERDDARPGGAWSADADAV